MFYDFKSNLLIGCKFVATHLILEEVKRQKDKFSLATSFFVKSVTYYFDCSATLNTYGNTNKHIHAGIESEKSSLQVNTLPQFQL